MVQTVGTEGAREMDKGEEEAGVGGAGQGGHLGTSRQAG